MKKFFIFIAAACLLTIGNVFASDQWSSPSETAYFQLGVYCDPTLSGGASQNLGTFFTEQTAVSISDLFTLTWYLTGPTTDVTSYTLVGSGHAGDLSGGAETNVNITSTGGNNDGVSILHGYWRLPVLISPGSPVHCLTGNTDCAINFVPESIDSHGTGEQTFNISLSVTVTL